MATSRNIGLGAPRGAALTLLGVLVLLAASAYAVFAAEGSPSFSISAAPTTQTVTRGDSASYTVTVTRANGFAEPISLHAGRLPAGASASWELSDGSDSNVLPPELDHATLTIETGSGTPPTTTHPVIRGEGGGLTRRTSVELTVVRPSQSNFAVAVTPTSRSVLQGDQTSYRVKVDRTRFRGAVDLSVSGLPAGATAAWSPSSTVPGAAGAATLLIETAADTPTGAETLTDW